MTNHNKLFILIAFSTTVRLILGDNLQLGNDEVYYWTYAKYPDWSHFDHPPMVGFLIQLFTFDLYFHSELALRLGTIILGSVSTYLIFLIGKEIYDEASGLIASVLYTISTYGFIISGLFIMPDAPLVFFWLLSLLFFIKQTRTKERSSKNRLLLLSFGALGFAIYSKYQAIYLLFAYFLYFIIYQRKQFKNPVFYISLSLPILASLIIFYWNYVNKFSGITYHSNRVSFFSRSFTIDSFLREFFGQIAYINPFNYVLIIISLIAYKRKRYFDRIFFNLLIFSSIPLILTTILISLFRDTLPHWSSIGYVTMIPISAIYLSNKKNTNYIYYIVGFIMILSLIGTGVVNENWFIKSNKDVIPEKLGKNDPTLDMFGWDQIKDTLIGLEKKDERLSDLPLVSYKWFPGAHLDYYVANPTDKKIYVLGNIDAIHKYYWINQNNKPLVEGEDAIYITHSRNFRSPIKTMRNYFRENELVSKFPIIRGGETVEYGYIYLVKSYYNKENTNP